MKSPYVLTMTWTKRSLLSGKSANRRSHRVPFRQQSLQHVPADKAGRAGEEDFHGEILNRER